MPETLRYMLLYYFTSKVRFALLALAVISVAFMILNVQHDLAYVGSRIAALGLIAEMAKEVRARRQKRGSDERHGERAPTRYQVRWQHLLGVLLIAVIALYLVGVLSQ